MGGGGWLGGCLALIVAVRASGMCVAQKVPLTHGVRSREEVATEVATGMEVATEVATRGDGRRSGLAERVGQVDRGRD